MTDRELLEKKLAFIETCVNELRRLARPELIETDVARNGLLRTPSSWRSNLH